LIGTPGWPYLPAKVAYRVSQSGQWPAKANLCLGFQVARAHSKHRQAVALCRRGNGHSEMIAVRRVRQVLCRRHVAVQAPGCLFDTKRLNRVIGLLGFRGARPSTTIAAQPEWGAKPMAAAVVVIVDSLGARTAMPRF